MAFPTVNRPIFTTTLPSTKETIKFSPFTVKEQRALLIAAQSNEADMTAAMKAAINDCTYDQLDVDNMPNFDLEYLFLQIRAKSVGENLELVLTCKNCKTTTDYNLDLTTVKVQETEGHSKKILLADNLGVFMRYPTTEMLNHLIKNYSTETVFDTVLACIETVFTDETVTQTKDESKEELVQWVLTLSEEQFSKMEDFFKTMPELRHKFTHTCSSCGTETEYEIKGLENFFA